VEDDPLENQVSEVQMTPKVLAASVVPKSILRVTMPQDCAYPAGSPSRCLYERKGCRRV